MTKQITRLLLAVAATPWFGPALAQGHHYHFARDVDAFHSVLAPVWHAAAGAERSRGACAQAGRMAALARDIRSADASALQAAVAALQGKCGATPADTDGALAEVHDAFHRLIEFRPAK